MLTPQNYSVQLCADDISRTDLSGVLSDHSGRALETRSPPLPTRDVERATSPLDDARGAVPLNDQKFTVTLKRANRGLRIDVGRPQTLTPVGSELKTCWNAVPVLAFSRL